jgi:hypothetical protein
MVTMKIALSVMGMLLSVLVYTAAFAAVTCAIHGARAIGWPALRNDPVFWLLLTVVVGGELWLGARWLLK